MKEKEIRKEVKMEYEILNEMEIIKLELPSYVGEWALFESLHYPIELNFIER